MYYMNIYIYMYKYTKYYYNMTGNQLFISVKASVTDSGLAYLESASAAGSSRGLMSGQPKWQFLKMLLSRFCCGWSKKGNKS